MDLHKNFLNFLLIQGHSYREGFLLRPEVSGKSRWRILLSKSPSQQVVIFLHGTGNDHLFGMYDMFTNLLNEGINIISLDLDGHGSESTTLFDGSQCYSTLSSLWDFHHKFWATTKDLLDGLQSRWTNFTRRAGQYTKCGRMYFASCTIQHSCRFQNCNIGILNTTAFCLY